MGAARRVAAVGLPPGGAGEEHPAGARRRRRVPVCRSVPLRGNADRRRQRHEQRAADQPRHRQGRRRHRSCREPRRDPISRGRFLAATFSPNVDAENESQAFDT